MATPVKLPELGESVTEGTVTRWLKQVGESVEVDEPLLEVSTDKVDTEIPSPVAGTLLEIRVQEDETVEVGAELAVVGDSDEAGSSESGSGADDQSTATDDADAEPTDEGNGDLAKAAVTAAPHGDGDRGGQAGDDDASVPAEEVEAVADTGASDDSGTQVTLPALGESVTEGTVTRWLKQVGDSVEVDEPLLEVSTDKVDTEIPSPIAGTVQSIEVQEDETVEVGAVLAVVGTGTASSDSSSDDAEATSDGEEPSTDSAVEGDAAGTDDAEGTTTEVDAQADQEPPPAQPETADPEPADTSADQATTPPAQSAKEQTSDSPSSAPGGPSRTASDSDASSRDDGSKASATSGGNAPAAWVFQSAADRRVRKTSAQRAVPYRGASPSSVCQST